jgi:hypothetical protein
VKAMLNITYKTRNENEKYESRKTKKDTTFSALKVPDGKP